MLQKCKTIPWLPHQRLNRQFCYSETCLGCSPAINPDVDGTETKKRKRTNVSIEQYHPSKLFPRNWHLKLNLQRRRWKLKDKCKYSKGNLGNLDNDISFERSVNILHIGDYEHQWLQRYIKCQKWISTASLQPYICIVLCRHNFYFVF